MNDIVRKLTSRKLWLALVGIASGLAMMFGVESTEIGEVAGAITALTSIVTYIIAEGRIDAESVKNVMTLDGVIVEDKDAETHKGVN